MGNRLMIIPWEEMGSCIPREKRVLGSKGETRVFVPGEDLLDLSQGKWRGRKRMRV